MLFERLNNENERTVRGRAQSHMARCFQNQNGLAIGCGTAMGFLLYTTSALLCRHSVASFSFFSGDVLDFVVHGALREIKRTRCGTKMYAVET